MPNSNTSPAHVHGDATAPIILITDPIDSDATALLRAVASVVHLGDPGYESVSSAVRLADVVIVRRQIPADSLSGAPYLRALIRNGVGLDFIPLELATQLGIAVVNTPGVNSRSVAEAAIGMMLAGFRRIALKDRMIRQGEWTSLRRDAFLEREIFGLRLGLIGYGAIAQEVARIAHDGFGMRVAVSVRSPRETPANVRQASLHELLCESDVIVVACPLTEETRGMLGAKEIAAMKPNAGVVNIARGAILDEVALATALRAGRLGFAALDVFSEQPLTEGNPLLDLDNVILTPHTAGITQNAMDRMSALSAEEATRIMRSERPINLVNAEAWDRIARRWTSMEARPPRAAK